MNTFHAHDQLRFTPKSLKKVSSYDFSSKRSNDDNGYQYDFCNKTFEVTKSIVTSDPGVLSPGLNDGKFNDLILCATLQPRQLNIPFY